jgi:ribosomal protein S18 acetylase RimI-like enzyme
MIIRAPKPTDEARWRQLWVAYNAFYQTSVPEDVTAFTWARFFSPESGLFLRVAEQDGEVVGFSACVLHPKTWSAAPVCYLEDLFVDPAVRGGGVGHALITHLIDQGRAQGWSQLYWHTREDNVTARRLYDRFTQTDGFVCYRVRL